jgi:uncharacterized protein (TIGR01244 family)
MSTSVPVSAIAADVFVAPQLTPEAMADVARMGIRSVVNNRPDFEGGTDQPTSVQIEAAARAARLEYRFLPVAGNYQSPTEIATMAQLLRELPRPILAFCRSGNRSTNLYVAAMRE